MKQLVAFDLDGTLAESKQPIGREMAGLIADLLDVARAAVISGGDWPQFKKQVVSRLPTRANLAHLFIMPTTGTKLYRHRADTGWNPVYADIFDSAQRDAILAALDKVIEKAGIGDDKTWGPRIEDRGSQITFSALGQQAPIDAKKAWDPTLKKRKALRKVLRRALPDLSINIGGATSIDITQKGVDKAYAMRRLAKESGIPVGRMLFFGDAIYPGGNDDAVRAAGMAAIKVRDPDDTATAIRAVCGCLR